MKVSTFDLEEERLQDEIRKQGAKRILFQLPEGLKAEGPRLASLAERMGAVGIVSADPCYGACDLAVQEAESLGADLLVHYGHSEMMPPQRAAMIYLEARSTISVKPAVKKARVLLHVWDHIGLVTTVQHISMLNEARTTLLEAGKSVAIGDAGHLEHAGQVTGCDYSNAKAISDEVDAFLFVGGGRFHAVGISLATGKPTIVADPYERRAYSVSDEVKRVLKQRWACICEAKEAKDFGVIIGLKTGQRKIERALQIKKKLDRRGKKTTLLALRELVPERLMQFPRIGVFVNTACPRIALETASDFPKPILTFDEALVVVGERDWEQVCKRGWFES
jgi:2-(3-amino-3-carboxypropyl)histidine synthase